MPGVDGSVGEHYVCYVLGDIFPTVVLVCGVHSSVDLQGVV